MPAGTVFMKFPAQPKDKKHINLGYDEVIMIKEDTLGRDYVFQGLFPNFEGAEDDNDWSDVMIAMLEGGGSPPLDYDCAARDALYDADQLFLVWNKEDLERMIERLRVALTAGYSGS